MEHILGSQERARYSRALGMVWGIFLLYMIFSLFSGVVSGILIILFDAKTSSSNTYTNIFNNIISISFNSLFLFISFFLIKLNNKEQRNIYLPSQSSIIKEIIPVFIFSYITIFCLNIILSASLSFLPSLQVSSLEIKEIFGSFSYFVLVLNIVIVAPIFEEFLFRGILYRQMEKFNVHPYFMIFTTSLLFGLAHIYALNIIMAFIMGLFLGFFRFYFRNIKLCILFHAIYNFLVIFILTLDSFSL